ncbi:MAG: hypothetical protein FOGNACKC_05734 [Anaerolineae bacterium]|nr:hypothetical protein [Anaerolineae bacterium]
MSRFLRFFVPLLLLALVVLPPARAQTGAPSLSITHIAAQAQNTGEVRVSALVSVLDEAGQPMNGLTADEFSVSENNTPVEAQRLTVSRADEPLTVALLIDTSNGMAKPGPDRVRAIDAAKDAAIAFIERLGDDDQVAVYEFNERASRVQDFTYDHNLAIDQGVVKLDAREAAGVCLNDALLQLLDQLAAQSDTPRAIVAIGGAPGGDGCGGAVVDDVLASATTVGNAVPLFSAVFGKTLPQDDLLRLGQRSGGRSLLGADSTSLAQNVASISEQLHSQYQLSYATQAAPGLATVIIFENELQLSDRRQIPVPAAAEPTPTPPPQFAISLAVNQPSGDTLEVSVEVPDGVTLAQTELFVNGESVQKATAPPLDKFTLNVNDLGSGKHTLRVEAVDTNQVTASAEVELMLTIPPTPTPAPTATPQPAAAAAPAQPAEPEAAPVRTMLPLALICVGAVLLLALGGVMVYLLMSRSKRPPAPAAVPAAPVSPPPQPASAPRPATAPPPPTIAADDDWADRTLLAPAAPGAPAAASDGPARLVVTAYQPLVPQPEFSLFQPETRLGRNTAKEAANDIPIGDQEVSRSHSLIVRRGQQYFIQDLNSTTGTQVNGQRLRAGQEVALQHGDEIAVGPRVKFRFESASSVDNSETLLDMDIDQLKSKFGAEDPFRTQYD